MKNSDIKLAVTGNPIEHSLSPLVHKEICGALGVLCEYEKISVKKGEVPEFVTALKELGLGGFNVTMPHKKDIIPFLDWISDEAREYLAVNTVLIKDGKLFGYNTDSVGFELSLKLHGAYIKNSNIMILGAGGAGRTIALYAAKCGAGNITVLNRDVSKAKAICDAISVKTQCGRLDNADKYTEDVDILVNATPLGMSGNPEFENLDFLKGLKNDATVFDLIYEPRKTELLKTAESMGYKIVDGIDMLICQAIEADKIFLGENFDGIQMYKTLVNTLHIKEKCGTIESR